MLCDGATALFFRSSGHRVGLTNSIDSGGQLNLIASADWPVSNTIGQKEHFLVFHFLGARYYYRVYFYLHVKRSALFSLFSFPPRGSVLCIGAFFFFPRTLIRLRLSRTWKGTFSDKLMPNRAFHETSKNSSPTMLYSLFAFIRFGGIGERNAAFRFKPQWFGSPILGSRTPPIELSLSTELVAGHYFNASF